MATSKKYFHDHLVLLLLTSNAFLALGGAIFLLWRLTQSHSTNYILQYRSSLGANAFKTGSLTDLLAFIAFGFVVLAIHALLSMRVYHIHRQFALAVLSLGLVLLVLNIIVANALLVLR
jgi:hypothetical protein